MAVRFYVIKLPRFLARIVGAFVRQNKESRT